MTTNPFVYSNVSLNTHKRWEEMGITKANAKIPRILADVIGVVASNNPLWSFVSVDPAWDNTVNGFTVFENGEQLGSVMYGYYRGNYGVEVRNERISAQRQRSNGYRTSDTKKAISAIKKAFTRKSPTEKLKTAQEDARALLQRQDYQKARDAHSAERRVNDEMLIFLKNDDAMRQLFNDYLHKEDKQHLLERYETANMEMMTIAAVQTQFGDGKAYLVVKTDGKYVVQIGDEVDIFDDNSLPENIRGKLGILKLVEDEQVVSSIGCRVNSETFVIVKGE